MLKVCKYTGLDNSLFTTLQVFIIILTMKKINCLMIFNARTDTVYFVKIADIDKAVFEFVNDAAEKQSKKNEQVLKLLGVKLK